jgi:hypothetical protein
MMKPRKLFAALLFVPGLALADGSTKTCKEVEVCEYEDVCRTLTYGKDDQVEVEQCDEVRVCKKKEVCE